MARPQQPYQFQGGGDESGMGWGTGLALGAGGALAGAAALPYIGRGIRSAARWGAGKGAMGAGAYADDFGGAVEGAGNWVHKQARAGMDAAGEYVPDRMKRVAQAFRGSPEELQAAQTAENGNLGIFDAMRANGGDISPRARAHLSNAMAAHLKNPSPDTFNNIYATASKFGVDPNKLDQMMSDAGILKTVDPGMGGLPGPS